MWRWGGMWGMIREVMGVRKFGISLGEVEVVG